MLFQIATWSTVVFGDPTGSLWFLTLKDMLPKKLTRINTYSSSLINVKPFSSECSLPWQCQLVQITSHPTCAYVQTLLEQSVARCRNKVEYSLVHGDTTKQKRGSKIIKTLTRLKIKWHGSLGSSSLAFWLLIGYSNYLLFLLQ